ncbi:MAG: hypothetical protein U0P45_07750 [Acidimicrobiales bacterium]
MSTALGERPVAWRGVDAPRPLEAEPDRDRWGPVVAWLIAVAGPWGWALRTGTPRPAVAALLLVATAAVAASRRLRPTAPTTIGAALLAGAAATAAAGPITGAWLATTIVTSRVVAPPPDRPLWTTLPRQARIAAAVLAVIAGTNAALGHTPIAVALAAIATTLVPLLLGRHGALAWVDRFAHAVGRVLTSVLFSILAVFLVLIPHGLSRLFRTDPLATPGHWDHPLGPARPPAPRGPTIGPARRGCCRGGTSPGARRCAPRSSPSPCSSSPEPSGTGSSTRPRRGPRSCWRSRPASRCKSQRWTFGTRRRAASPTPR